MPITANVKTRNLQVSGSTSLGKGAFSVPVMNTSDRNTSGNLTKDGQMALVYDSLQGNYQLQLVLDGIRVAVGTTATTL
jgi:hypothetical protein